MFYKKQKTLSHSNNNYSVFIKVYWPIAVGLLIIISTANDNEDPNHLWPFFYEELRIRLQNAQAEPFKGASTTIAGSSKIPFNLSRLEFLPYHGDIFGKRDMMNMHHQIYAHIFLIACEDLEVYKRKVLGQLTTWLDAIHTRKGQQCLLIQITSSSGDENIVNGKSRPILSRADLVFEQLSADFGGNTSNRIFQLRLRDRNDDTWNSMVLTLSDAVFHSFWSKLESMEEDNARLEAQKDLPGWNFCSFFISKECIALALVDANLIDRALDIYKDLELGFVEYIYKQKANDNDTHAWYSLTGHFNLHEISEILSEKQSKTHDERIEECRKKIGRSEIDLSEFYTYIFYRKIKIFLRLGLWSKIFQEFVKFVTLITEHADDLKEAKCQKYEFLVKCLNAYDDACGNLSEDKTQILFERGQLALAARNYQSQAVTGTASLGFVKDQPLFTRALDEFQLRNSSDLLTGTLLSQDALKNPTFESFVFSYLCLTDLAIQGFKARSLHAYMLQLDQAACFVLLKKHNEAIPILNELIDSSLSKWPSLMVQMLGLRSSCFYQLGSLDSALKDILDRVAFSNTDPSISLDISSLIDRLQMISKESRKQLFVSLDSLFSITLTERSTKEGNCVVAHINVNLPTTLTHHGPLLINVDLVELCVAGNRPDLQLRSRGAIKLDVTSANSINLYPESGADLNGVYTIVELSICIGAVKFSKNYISENLKKTLDLSSQQSHLSVAFCLPTICYLDRPQLQISITNTGKESIDSGYLKIISRDLDFLLEKDVTWEKIAGNVPSQIEILSVTSDESIETPLIESGTSWKCLIRLYSWANESALIKFEYRLGRYILHSASIKSLICPQWRAETEALGDSLARATFFSLGAQDQEISYSASLQDIKNGLEEDCRLLHNFTLRKGQSLSRIIKNDWALVSSIHDNTPNITIFTLGSQLQQAINITFDADLSANAMGKARSAQITFKLGLNSSFNDSETLFFKLLFSPESWMIAGPHHGGMKLRELSPSKTINLSLIPVKAGYLALPRVLVSVGSSEYQKSCGYTLVVDHRPLKRCFVLYDQE